ncbi:MAG TPA: hypothetical protein VGE45_10145 [Chloroflexia bacterium]
MLRSGADGQRAQTLRAFARFADLASWLLWVVAGLAATLFCLRFGMRALGVRPDIPLPGLLYALTAPFVQPFYRLFPITDRYDRYDLPVVEVASLAASGSVLGVALLVYVVGLMLFAKAR